MQIYSTRALFENAIIEKDQPAAVRLMEILRKEPCELAELKYDEARIHIISDNLRKAVANLREMRVLDGAPYGTYRFLKALCKYRLRKSLAKSLFAELDAELRSYRPHCRGQPSKKYYGQRLAELEWELKNWDKEPQL